MSKKNKVIYSNIQPNTKEAGIWVNTDDGNVKVEKDGKWVDDGGSGSSDGVKWEYYKIDWDNASFNGNAMYNVFNFVMLANFKDDNLIFIGPKGVNFYTTVAIAGISVKYMIGESVIDTGSWLNNIKESDEFFGNNYDYSFLIPITEEEFYSDNFDYPSPSEPV